MYEYVPYCNITKHVKKEVNNDPHDFMHWVLHDSAFGRSGIVVLNLAEKPDTKAVQLTMENGKY